jgi:hypothetical protein
VIRGAQRLAFGVPSRDWPFLPRSGYRTAISFARVSIRIQNPNFRRMGARAVDWARLESVCTERYRGFESRPIRHYGISPLTTGCYAGSTARLPKLADASSPARLVTGRLFSPQFHAGLFLAVWIGNVPIAKAGPLLILGAGLIRNCVVAAITFPIANEKDRGVAICEF